MSGVCDSGLLLPKIDVAVDDLFVTMKMGQAMCDSLGQSHRLGRGNAAILLFTDTQQNASQIEAIDPRQYDSHLSIKSSDFDDLDDLVVALGQSLQGANVFERAW